MLNECLKIRDVTEDSMICMIEKHTKVPNLNSCTGTAAIPMNVNATHNGGCTCLGSKVSCACLLADDDKSCHRFPQHTCTMSGV